MPTLHLRPRLNMLLRNVFSVWLILLSFLFTTSIKAQETQAWVIVPQPNSITKGVGAFALGNGVTILPYPTELLGAVRLFQGRLHKLGIPSGNGSEQVIQLSMTGQQEMEKEAYLLDITPSRVVITAATPAGISYALTTISQQLELSASKQLPTGQIQDGPRFAHRGFMLDESRHIFGKEKVCQLLDLMAGIKLNTFHWHLTDDTGWRLAINALPKLATIGGRGNYSDADGPVQYYTQAEIREIVRYAADRFITIVPEIDMPGHARAANRAYPEFSGGGSEKHPDFTFNPGKDTTYGYLTTILREVAELFPSKYIHLGGDEVHFGNQQWKTDKGVSNLRAKEGLNELVDVEHYFIRRMADSLVAMDRHLAGWDEVVASGISNEQTLVYWWRHDKKGQLKKALSAGFNTVLCPRRPLYFDFVQHEDHDYGRRWDGFAPIEDVYGYPDNTHQFTDSEQKLIQGIQGNLWTERIPNDEWVDFMTFPRIFALSESAWTQKVNKELTAFNDRLPALFSLLDKKGVRYFNSLHPDQSPEPKH